LTRTDFLLQFVWQPPKPEDRPKDDAERLARYNDFKTKMEAEEKNHPAVRIKSEEIEAASLKQSEVINSAINKALNGPGGAGAAGPGGGAPGTGALPNPTPGFGPPPGGANAPAANKGATAPPPK